jgi:2-polyprenyl-3-methyl-5-hydroxy-6-metoxy-1,4-benzoquinol methylase
VRISDHRYGTTLSLARCRRCGFVFADDNELSRMPSLYEGLEDPEYEGTQDTRLLQMRWLLESALRHHPRARTALDVGAGTGLLVGEARARGLDAVGVEPSRSLVEVGRSHGNEILEGVLPHPELEGRRFDLVFLVDVIEHVADPVALLEQCAMRMAPSGMLVTVTPDVGSVAARLLGRRWWHYRLAHIGYFDSRSLDAATRAAGLSIQSRARAKWFFPVHYLAERAGHYLPLGWLNRAARQPGPLARLYRQVVPLDLRDSFVLHLTHAKEAARV